jgi:exopolysaccharide biosynthesis protein
MPLTKEVARQYPLVAVINVSYADIAAGANIAAELPLGAVITNGSLVVDTAFNSTTNTISVGDSASATRYSAAVDVKTLARTALTITGFKVTEATKNLLLTYALTGAAAGQGAVRVIIEYVVGGKANEVHG